MTMIVGSYKKPMTFEEFMLSEGVEPVETKYGCNPPYFNDNKISIMGNIVVTFFIYKDLLYFVQKQIHTGEIGFAKAKTVPQNIKELEDIVFDVDPVKSSDGLGVLNRSFYVFTKLLDTEGNKNIFFKPANSDLDKIYSLLTRSKFFNEKLNTLGYSNMYFNSGVYKIDKHTKTYK